MEKEVGFVLQLKAKDATEWCYRGEGAANLVLAYQGSDTYLVGKVLRLKKILLEGEHVRKNIVNRHLEGPILVDDEQKLWADWPSVAGATSSESLLQAYATDVMSPLLGSEHVDPGILVHVSSEFLEIVADNVRQARPLSRISISEIDTCCGSALLISDHCIFWPMAADYKQCQGFLPSISVEIKPKCGFLPNSDFIDAKNSIKKRIPRFTMHQILKLSQGQVNVLSGYSPLDLFSENLERIKQAVESLFAIPQNNLRIFVGGSIVKPVISDPNSNCANWQALKDALQNCIFCEDKVDLVEVLKELVAQSLHETNALRNLFAAQKLDTLDIEGAIHAYRKTSCSQAIDCWNGNPSNIADRSGAQIVGFLNALSLSECRQLVRNYLIAATAKDCSLMLTIQQIQDLEKENANSKHCKLISSSKARSPFRLKINFLDLDLKPLSKMSHYHELDQEIVTAYLAATLPQESS